MTEEIAKKITDLSGTYSGYDIFSDWIKSLAISISNSTDLVESEIWKQREAQYMDIVRKHGEKMMHNFCELSGMLIAALDARDVCTLMRMDGSRPVKGWQPSAEELIAETWELTK